MGDIVVGIDIGSSKVCTTIGRVNRADALEILGEGMDLCNGVKKGVIVDIDSTSRSIRASIEQAESMANLRIGSAYFNISGAHAAVISKRSSVSVAGENREIDAEDVDRVLYNARSIPIPQDRQLIDVIPRQYIIDGYDEIIDPIGMVGVKLEVDADIVVGKITSVQNIVKSAEKANIKVDGLVVETMATSEMVLTSDEKDMGVVMIDVGGSTTDVSAYKNRRLVHYDSLPVGGDHITNDISIGLKISHADAERIKRQYELALTSLIKNDQEILVNELNENKKKSLKVSELVEIIEARVYEIFLLCHKNLTASLGAVSACNAGVVLTGGGISYVDGGRQLAGEIFEMPVRVAPLKFPGLTKPECVTASGIVKYVSGNFKGRGCGSEVRSHRQDTKRKTGFFRSIYKKLF